jgi:hypothetical protein
MRHPSETDLALFAGGDLGLADRWRFGRHVKRCPECSAEVASFRLAVTQAIEEASELPARLQWDRLADEMVANIHVGIEAAECVTPVHHSATRIDWRAAIVMAGMSVVLLAAWFLNPIPRRVAQVMQAPKIEIRTTSAGLELNENGNTMVLMHGDGAQTQRTIIVSAPGTLRARYADGDTGQMTINNVYSE